MLVKYRADAGGVTSYLQFFMPVILSDMIKNTPTRYFLFSRVNPKDDDYDLLIERCIRLGIYAGFRTISPQGVERLVGFLIFKDGRVLPSALVREFPNFLVIPMGSHGWPDESKGFTYFGGHPFDDLKHLLF